MLGGYTGGGHGGRAQEGTDKGNGNSNEDLDGNTDVDAETFGKLHQIKHVLERWEISGINRKLQLKPLQWEEFEPEDDLNGVYDNDGGVDGGAQTGTKANGVSPQEPLQSSAEVAVGISEDIGALAGIADDFSSSVGGEGVKGGGKSGGKRERVTELLLILKWGGELTNLGQRQAIELGNSFRTIMYPDAGSGGLLRLHRCVCVCVSCCGGRGREREGKGLACEVGDVWMWGCGVETRRGVVYGVVLYCIVVFL